VIFHVVIPVFNRLPLTRECLRSLCAQTDREFRVLVVDDGSTDGTPRAVIDEFGSLIDVRVIHGNGNLWWGGGIRTGVEEVLRDAGDADYVVTLNNDVTVPPRFFETARRAAKARPGAMFAGVSVDATNPTRVAQTGWRMISWPLAYTERVWWPSTIDELQKKPPFAEVDFVPGTATFTPVLIVKRVGTIDSKALPHYHGDSEYAFRVKKNGHPVLLCRDLLVYHNLDSTETLGNRRARLTLRDVGRSFFTRRSGNSLKYKWRFARACCPPWALVPFIVSDTFKVAVRALGVYLVGERVNGLKALVNAK
jgi:GT2 family glycosyltransferase